MPIFIWIQLYLTVLMGTLHYLILILDFFIIACILITSALRKIKDFTNWISIVSMRVLIVCMLKALITGFKLDSIVIQIVKSWKKQKKSYSLVIEDLHFSCLLVFKLDSIGILNAR